LSVWERFRRGRWARAARQDGHPHHHRVRPRGAGATPGRRNPAHPRTHARSIPHPIYPRTYSSRVLTFNFTSSQLDKPEGVACAPPPTPCHPPPTPCILPRAPHAHAPSSRGPTQATGHSAWGANFQTSQLDTTQAVACAKRASSPSPSSPSSLPRRVYTVSPRHATLRDGAPTFRPLKSHSSQSCCLRTIQNHNKNSQEQRPLLDHRRSRCPRRAPVSVHVPTRDGATQSNIHTRP
jgi:hypothetical protein